MDDLKLQRDLYFLDHGIDLDKRRIVLTEEVNEEMHSKVLKAVLKMEDDNTNPITVYLNSEGGEVYSGLGIYDVLRSAKSDIHIHASGAIMSAAALIFLAGDKRYASENVSFMIHSMSAPIPDNKVRDQQVELDENKRINNKMIDILVKRVKMKRALAYRKINSNDWYIGLEEAKTLKIVNC